MATKTITLTDAETAVVSLDGASILSEYEYLTDASVKFNGTTYTVERDSATGLISKISDSNGNEFEPTINSGITDVSLHNAVFWAVAMARGIGGSSAPKPIIELLFNDSLENTGSGEFTIEPGTDSAEILYASGLNGKCYSATNYSGIVIRDVSALLLSDFTITFWTKINSTGLSLYPQYRRFVWWNVNNAYRGLEIGYDGSTSTNLPSFVLTDGVNGENASTAIDDGAWHSIAIVQRGNTIITTVDQDEQILWNSCILSPTENYLALSNIDYSLNGYISSFRVFDRALSYAEIERVFALDSPKFIMDGIIGMFTPDTRDIGNSLWRNAISGYNDMMLSGGNISENAVHFNAGEYGSFVCDEPNTVYYVGKLICDDTGAQEYHPMVGKQLTSKRHGYGFDLYGYCNNNLFCSLMFSGYDNDIDSSVDSSQYHVVCYTRNGNTATFYVDGIMIGTENAYMGYYSGNMLLNKSSRGGTPSIFDYPKESFIKYCAFGTTYHDEATVRKNMTYLSNKYL